MRGGRLEGEGGPEFAAILRDASLRDGAPQDEVESESRPDEIMYAAPPVAIRSPVSLTISVCATATRLPRRTTRPVATKYLPCPGRR